MTKYKIEETKGFTKTIGNYVVKRNGKGIQYFWTRAEAAAFIQNSDFSDNKAKEDLARYERGYDGSWGITVVDLDEPKAMHFKLKNLLGE